MQYPIQNIPQSTELTTYPINPPAPSPAVFNLRPSSMTDRTGYHVLTMTTRSHLSTTSSYESLKLQLPNRPIDAIPQAYTDATELGADVRSPHFVQILPRDPLQPPV
ncbi:hypothetical protein CIB48_g864 [Xylaria polymorpha]|nr:hypothetical protein CIB48_g864 [Xylaria polymorpha]